MAAKKAKDKECEEAPWPHPRETAVLRGQEAAEGVLLRAQAFGRLPHAWLLTGPRGVGKATLAYRFARFLLAPAASAGGGRPWSPYSPAAWGELERVRAPGSSAARPTAWRCPRTIPSSGASPRPATAIS